MSHLNLFISGVTGISYKKIEEQDSLISSIEKTAYFAGRTVRFGVCVIGAVPDLALQILQSLTYTFAIVCVKGESYLTKTDPNKTYSDNLGYIPFFIGEIRNKCLGPQIKNVAKDISSFANYIEENDFAKNYSEFLLKTFNL